MNAMIHQILFFFIFPVIIHCKNSCPVSSCGNFLLPIKYPFKLEADHPPKNCYDFINLRCDDQGQVVINLQSSGDFYVTSINYYLKTVTLTDPGHCLLGRLMMTNISLYPLNAFFYENYTYYTCPKDRIRFPFSEIQCLSNSTNAIIATTEVSRSFMEEMYGCFPIVSSVIPVSWSSKYNYSGNFDDLQLTWNVPECRGCDDYGPEDSDDLDDSKSRLVKFVESPAFITSAGVLVTFSGIACLLRLTKLITDRANTDNTTANNSREDAATIESSAAASTTGAPPQATAVQPGTTTGTLGNKHSEVKKFSEVVFVGESQGTLVSCSICLEEYNGKDRVRNLGQCGHYFHVECIDQWLLKNNSCPVCRNSLS